MSFAASWLPSFSVQNMDNVDMNVNSRGGQKDLIHFMHEDNVAILCTNGTH